jgi:hypothetical protein
VNEADEKIRPSFSIELRDVAGRLRGGACGAVHEFNGKRFVYLAAMTMDVGLPPSTGIALGEALLDFLRSLGVSTVHLGKARLSDRPYGGAALLTFAAGRSPAGRLYRSGHDGS